MGSSPNCPGLSFKDNLDLHKAERILNDDHYGLKKVKERSWKLSRTQTKTETEGPFLCLVGLRAWARTAWGAAWLARWAVSSCVSVSAEFTTKLKFAATAVPMSARCGRIIQAIQRRVQTSANHAR